MSSVTRERVGGDADVGEQLLAEQAEAAAVEQAFAEVEAEEGRVGEQADGERADEAGHEVDADDVERVVVAEAVLDLDGEAAGDTGEGTDGDRRIPDT